MPGIGPGTVEVLNAQEQESVVLIKPTVEELVISKINSMRENNLTVDQQERLVYLRAKIQEKFTVLVRKYYGLSIEQIKEFSEKEIPIIFDMVYKKAKKTSLLWKIFFCIPIMGWIPASIVSADTRLQMGGTWPDSMEFTIRTKEIKKMLGQNFDPAKIILGK